MVLPVYNTEPYLAECMDSLLGQDLAPSELEIVAVDDGSTDGSGELLDKYAADHDHVVVFHQANSGWPGQPRNRATRASTGRYVFYMDSDDYLGGEALRRMCDYADEHDSDIVLPKMVPSDDRPGRWLLWSETQVDADLRLAFKTLSPQKLLRRSLIEDHDLRFPEGMVRLEDGIVLARAYFFARRVSLLGGYDFYFKRLQDEAQNISKRAINPAGYVGSVREIMDSVRELCPDKTLADDIVLDLYRRKALRRLRPDRILGYRPPRQQAWVTEAAQLAEDHVPRELQQRLKPIPRLQSEFARRDDLPAVLALAEADAAARPPTVRVAAGQLVLEAEDSDGRDRTVTELVELVVPRVGLRQRATSLDLVVNVGPGGLECAPLPLQVELFPQRGGRPLVLPLATRATGPRAAFDYAARLPLDELGRASATIYQIWVVAPLSPPLRVWPAVPKSAVVLGRRIADLVRAGWRVELGQVSAQGAARQTLVVRGRSRVSALPRIARQPARRLAAVVRRVRSAG